MDNAQTPTEDTWVLGRSVPGRVDLGLEATFTTIRDLDTGESDEIFAAAALFRAFGPDWSHHRTRHASDRVVQAVRASDPTAFDDVAAGWLIRQLVAATIERFAIEEPGPATTEALAGAAETRAMALMELLMSAEWRVVVTDNDGRSICWIAFAGSPLVPLEAWLAELAGALGAVSDAELVDAADALSSGALRLAALHGEIGWGLVGLARRADVNGERGNTIGLEGLPLDLVDPTMSMVAIATARRSGKLRAAITAMADAGETEQPGTGGTDGVPEPERASNVQNRDRDPKPPRAPDEPALPAAVVDLVAFVQEVLSASSAMEARWSAALAATRSDDLDTIGRQMGAVGSALHAQIQLDDQRRGNPIHLPGLPLQPIIANTLELNPNGMALDRQRALAITLAFEDLARAFGALRTPTAGVVDPLNGTVRSWWSQQGFMRVNLLGEQLVRVSAAGAPSEHGRQATMASAALQAWAFGQPEATAIYLLGALDHTEEAAGPLADAFATLHRSGTALGAGTPVALETLVPLTRFWTDELRRRHARPVTITAVPEPIGDENAGA